MTFAARSAPQKRVLNTGSGPYHADKLHPAFRGGDWKEVRLDIDPRVEPDVVGSVNDMRAFAADNSYDAIWSSHNVEHLHAHEVQPTFREFARVLKPSGFALITCPDLEIVARLIADGKMDQVVYVSPAGPITPLDMLFGHSASIASGNVYMAHNTGFTGDRLGRVGLDAGFREVRIARGTFGDIWALALMPTARLEDVAPLFRGTPQVGLVQRS
ncbi:Predicted SAM-depedendent methyltransferase [Methylobacterium sp. 174MFSha1.1]|uniref:class I SAM-dependent methyltransferase n=1 Tax=Methylobacterium sp. 174MFSha1.1 TaxID=1502749 RepID=UPI0008ECF291|nr:methyltransferase domain-containing protein [Methylobacterium sp. 174MFSha1.1]SFU46481.1 Predicted SAM-depedendent methyltransferase [Methylobacterium sp. 174MFSha1.1]